MIGTWDRVDDSTTYNDDGTYRVGTPFSGKDEITADFGQFQLEGSLLTFESDDGSAYCPGQDGTYEVEMITQDEFLLILREDDCFDRSIIITNPSSGQPEWNRRSP